MAQRLSLIVPTFNESQNLPVLVERIAQALGGNNQAYEIVVVDDDSPDKTWQVAEALGKKYSQVRVIRRTSGEKGLAPAVVEGWKQARFEIVGVMDADLQHPPELLPQILARFDQPDVDVTVASRYTADAGKLKWNPVRKWISRGASNLAQAVLPPQAYGVTDPMSGFFFVRRSILDGASLDVRGYKILLEVLSRTRYRRVEEVPFAFGRRQHGQSKLGAQVMRDYLLQLWSLIWVQDGFDRFVRYCLVGCSGLVVHLGMLALLREKSFLGKLEAPAVAIEFAIINNFIWNEWWTFRDRSRLAPHLLARLFRFTQFNLVCGVGALLDLFIVWLFAIRLNCPYFATNVLAIMLVTVWNYGLNTAWTWTRISALQATHR